MSQAAANIRQDFDSNNEKPDTTSSLLNEIRICIEGRDYKGLWDKIHQCAKQAPESFCCFIREDLDPLYYASQGMVVPALHAITAITPTDPEAALETFKALYEKLPHALKEEVLEAPIEICRMPVMTLMEHAPYATTSFLSSQWNRCRNDDRYGFHHMEPVRRLCGYANVPDLTA